MTTAKNDITGDKIKSRTSNRISDEHWESIFGASKWDMYMEVKLRKEQEEKEKVEKVEKVEKEDKNK